MKLFGRTFIDKIVESDYELELFDKFCQSYIISSIDNTFFQYIYENSFSIYKESQDLDSFAQRKVPKLTQVVTYLLSC